jgi:hypothetical protein
VAARWEVRSVPCVKRVIPPPFPCHSRRMREAGHWPGMTVYLIRRLEGESDREIASDKPKVKPPRTGYPPRIEQCVCVYGGLTVGYEAHGIGGQIRKTRTGIEGPGNAMRRRTEGPLAQPLWTKLPPKIHRSLLIAAVAHRMQENAFGALKSSVRRHLMQAANNPATRRLSPQLPSLRPRAGTVLVRD